MQRDKLRRQPLFAKEMQPERAASSWWVGLSGDGFRSAAQEANDRMNRQRDRLSNRLTCADIEARFPHLVRP